MQVVTHASAAHNIEGVRHRSGYPRIFIKKIAAFVLAGLLLGVANSRGNGIAITNATLHDLDNAQNYINIQFDVSWSNSWRSSTLESNWDAAWVFAKYRPQGSNTWQHVLISTNAAHHFAPTAATLEVGLTGTNGVGAFIYRSSNGTGGVSYAQNKLRWYYGNAGLQEADNIEIALFAIEMVYVPQGSFYVGDGSVTSIEGHFEDGTNGTPFQITNEFYSITLGGGGAGSLGNNNAAGMVGTIDDFNDSATHTLPAAFPKGFNAFYCMKYEMSQGEYASFLGNLDSVQVGSRDPGAYGNTRYTVQGTVGNYSADAPDRACSIMNWMHGLAYADWAGLRPMTELEYEKACRGTNAAVTDEYVWGTVNLTVGNYGAVVNDGKPNATMSNIGNGTGNANVKNIANVIWGPVRCGIFAATISGATREECGGTFYGIMEMAGNLSDRAVSVGHASGRPFTGTHGDGTLTSDGFSDNSDWPGFSAGKVSGANGGGFRGGNWNDGPIRMRTSDRAYATWAYTTANVHYGFRCVRTAP